MKAKSGIPVFNQSEEAVGGIHIMKLSVQDADQHARKLGIHRDDFFIFFVLTSGWVVMQCDLVEIEINATNMVVVKPFQVHSVKGFSADAAGYFISVAPFLIPNACSGIFQDLEISEQAKKLDNAIKENLLSHISLLHHAFTQQQMNKTRIINGLFSALVYQFSNFFQTSEMAVAKPKNQSALITARFKNLVHENNFLESPSFFAKNLNISTSHLNDCVNATTGKSATYWIQQVMITEAQRLLYYTENDVKEIAFTLGFEDHSYFSRLFKKNCQQTPLAFRKKFRE